MASILFIFVFLAGPSTEALHLLPGVNTAGSSVSFFFIDSPSIIYT